MRRVYRNMLWLCAVLGCFFSQSALADWGGKVRAFSLVPTSQSSLCTDGFFESVRNLQSIGANRISIIVPYSQQTLTASDIFPYSRTPSDAALTCGIQYIQSQGMEFGLNLVINVPDWRARIDPVDRDRWFRQMGDIAIKYARDFASPYGASHMSVGTEMYRTVSHNYSSLNVDTPERYRWPDIIADVRRNYGGIVTYSAQHSGEFSVLQEPNDLIPNIDILGFSGYWALNSNNLSGLQSEWNRIERDHIQPAIDRYGKRVFISELGYRPCGFTFEQPYNSWETCDYNGGAQATAWEAFLAFFSNKSYFDGLIGGWAWEDNPDIGGVGDLRYTPWRKEAAEVFRRYWGSGGGEPAPEPSPEPVAPPAPTPVTFPYGESQLAGVPYCDPADTAVPDHGWGNLAKYGQGDAGCIYPASAADNPFGDPARGFMGGGEPSPPVPMPTEPTPTEPMPPVASEEYPFGESQVAGVPYCSDSATNVPDHGWGNLSNFGYRDAGCIFPASAADNPFGDSGRGYQPIGTGGGGPEPTTPEPTTPASGDFPYGESQLSGVPYCSAAETNIPDHGWGNLSNYGHADAGCIFAGSASDNPFGDPGRGFQSGGDSGGGATPPTSPTPPASGSFPYGESQLSGTPYCSPDEVNVPDHGWGNLSNYGFSDAGCIFPMSAADNPHGDSGRGYQPVVGGSGETPTVPEPSTPGFPFGQSQVASVGYCDPGDPNVPDHGWGDLAKYGYSAAGCIYQGGSSDNPFGDPARGYQP